MSKKEDEESISNASLVELLSRLDQADGVAGEGAEKDNASKKKQLMELLKQNGRPSGRGSVTINRSRDKSCSFCGAKVSEGYVSGKNGVVICKDCIELCKNILDDEGDA